jgi:hypothetical protein
VDKLTIEQNIGIVIEAGGFRYSLGVPRDIGSFRLLYKYIFRIRVRMALERFYYYNSSKDAQLKEELNDISKMINYDNTFQQWLGLYKDIHNYSNDVNNYLQKLDNKLFEIDDNSLKADIRLIQLRERII